MLAGVVGVNVHLNIYGGFGVEIIHGDVGFGHTVLLGLARLMECEVQPDRV